MLVKWGCDKADKLNLLATLHTSPVAEKLYTRHGFEIKKVSEQDLRPWGVEETVLRKGMIRLPRTPTTAS